MNRRSFLKAIVAVPLAAVTLPQAIGAKAPALTFHKDAFAFVMADLKPLFPPRFDVLYGYGIFDPARTIRITPDVL